MINRLKHIVGSMKDKVLAGLVVLSVFFTFVGVFALIVIGTHGLMQWVLGWVWNLNPMVAKV